MTKLCTGFAAALVSIGFILSSASLVQAGDVRCTHTAAQYSEAIRHFESEAAKANALVQTNPLYESDVAYYTSVLNDARQCVKNLTPVVAASR